MRSIALHTYVKVFKPSFPKFKNYVFKPSLASLKALVNVKAFKQDRTSLSNFKSKTFKADFT